MKRELALATVLGLLAGGCAEKQASEGGTFDFEPLPRRDTASNDRALPSTTLRRSLGKPIPAPPGQVAPADEHSNSPGPELLRERKRYEAVAI